MPTLGRVQRAALQTLKDHITSALSAYLSAQLTEFNGKWWVHCLCAAAAPCKGVKRGCKSAHFVRGSGINPFCTARLEWMANLMRDQWAQNPVGMAYLLSCVHAKGCAYTPANVGAAGCSNHHCVAKAREWITKRVQACRPTAVEHIFGSVEVGEVKTGGSDDAARKMRREDGQTPETDPTNAAKRAKLATHRQSVPSAADPKCIEANAAAQAKLAELRKILSARTIRSAIRSTRSGGKRDSSSTTSGWR